MTEPKPKGSDEWLIEEIHVRIRMADRRRKHLEKRWLETRGSEMKEEILRLEGMIEGFRRALALTEEKRNRNLFPL